MSRRALPTLQDTLRPGLQALLENAGYAGRPVTAETVSYGLAPRLNAAGRMDTAAVALKLLLCENEEQAAGIAARLFGDQHQPSAGGTADRCRCTGKTERRPCPCSGPCNRGIRRRLAPGVIGIVATRLMEKYGRPSIVISTETARAAAVGAPPPALTCTPLCALAHRYCCALAGIPLRRA